MNLILGLILGGAIVSFIYESYYERKEKKISLLMPTKLEKLIEMSSIKISQKQKLEERVLTEKEKDEILDKCYNDM